MSQGVLSKGIKLSYSTNLTTPSYTALTDLQEIPNLGGQRDSVEKTTLDDDAHTYMNGLQNYGDSVDFVFLHDSAQFGTLSGLTQTQEYMWKVEFPDGTAGAVKTSCTFKAMPSVSINAVGINEPLKYTLSLKPTTAMTFAQAS